MTRDEQSNDDLWQPHSEIDALLDGEPVDTQRLRAVLDDERARDYLVEALVLRQITREMEPSRFVIPATRRGPIYSTTRWLAAGVLLAIGLGAGYAYGQVSGAQAPSTGAVEVVLAAPTPAPALPAPEPTKTIRFEPGVNWTTTPRSR
jgi:hypothetical protein